MVQPFIKSPLGGILGARTMAFYRLDSTGTQPIEPLGDLIPSLTSDRIALDVVDSEDVDRSYSVTLNALQDFTSATSNVHKNPERITVSGTLVSSIDLGPVGSAGFAGLRADLIRVANRSWLCRPACLWLARSLNRSLGVGTQIKARIL